MREDTEHRELTEEELSSIRDFELSREEYDFMVDTLLKGRKDLLQKFNMIFTNDGVVMIMERGTSYEIRDIATDMLTSHLDKKNKPTKTGVLLEGLIAKINLD